MKRFPVDLSPAERIAIGIMVGLLTLATCFTLSLFAYTWLSPPPAPEMPTPLPAQQLAPPTPIPTLSPTPALDTPTPYPTSTNTPTATSVVPPTFTRTPTAIIVLPPTNTPRPAALPTSTPRPIINTPPPVPTQIQAACDCGGDFYNCDDFTSWEQAQQCFEYCLDQGRGDIHGLDRNNNFIVCESDR